ncbi:MAG: bifunctional transaldolase/phosoglucose isomerase [Nitrospirales bacterium]|nr:bifunctional transaldolase/phosoglucose isomerase [Nitrospira sp.]MDR4501745.1 bifunctional transaldolase/phosoglucose isomerase [Nitrospirales bacterium]
MNPLVQLEECGQSPWYDYIRRGLMTSGELGKLIEQDGLMGMTSNPAIFEKAIAGSSDYDESLTQAAVEVIGVKEIYERLAIQDIQDAADIMHVVYERTKGRDGYVSLEVSPTLAYDTQGSIDEAVRLHQAVARKNVMIKVPATAEGLPAIEELIARGININVTLLFSVDMYVQVAWRYIHGLERLAKNGGDVSQMASVASFFVSRIDSLIDKQLEAKLHVAKDADEKAVLEGLMGTVAIANAKLAYEQFEEIFNSPEFQALKAKGARPQRVLWASTGTKNPKYPDTLYVDNLIGSDTVNTMPEATFTAFRDHGVVKSTIGEGLAEAKATMKQLAEAGISMEEVTNTLLRDGARLFVEAFEQLMGVISRKRADVLGEKIDRVSYALGTWEGAVNEQLAELQKNDVVRRVWAKDPTVWHRDAGHQKIIRQALGWLTISQEQLPHVSQLQAVAKDVKEAGFKHVLLLGMGGSSLCPEVLRMTFGTIPGYPELHVLDSTVPSQVRAFENQVDLAATVCIVASKSGSTTEPLVFQKYFYERMKQVVGDKAGDHFIAITDPGSLLEGVAKQLKFRHILPGVPEIGGRYSALSNFGIVPAALMGLDIDRLLQQAERMRYACDASVPAADNPGVKLGAVLGTLAKAGRDKLTFVTSPAIWDLGAWLEQLVAESTGKEGTGIIPVAGEPLGGSESYGQDRIFAYVRYSKEPCPEQDAKISELEKAGHPVIRVDHADLMNVGQEFFLWEMATAVAGSILKINAFDQPNVQESKDYTKAYLDEFKKTGKLSENDPMLIDEGIQVYADKANHAALNGASSLEAVLAKHLARVKSGDYVAINAYVEHTEEAQGVFQRLRTKIRDTKHVATTLGYGPRFLHSTGQLHKGGPNSGVFIQVTCEDAEDLAIPGEPYTFGVLKAAQALGDLKSLTAKGRRVIRVHVRSDVLKDLARLEQAVEAGLCVGKQ